MAGLSDIGKFIKELKDATSGLDVFEKKLKMKGLMGMAGAKQEAAEIQYPDLKKAFPKERIDVIKARGAYEQAGEFRKAGIIGEDQFQKKMISYAQARENLEQKYAPIKTPMQAQIASQGLTGAMMTKTPISVQGGIATTIARRIGLGVSALGLGYLAKKLAVSQDYSLTDYEKNAQAKIYGGGLAAAAAAPPGMEGQVQQLAEQGIHASMKKELDAISIAKGLGDELVSVYAMADIPMTDEFLDYIAGAGKGTGKRIVREKERYREALDRGDDGDLSEAIKENTKAQYRSGTAPGTWQHNRDVWMRLNASPEN